MFDVVGDLKDRLEAQASEFYEKWDLVDTCGWLVPDKTDDVAFMAEQGRLAEKEASVITILEMVRSGLEAVPAPLIAKTESLHRDLGAAGYEKAVSERIQAIGFGADTTDAIRFVEALNMALDHDK